MLKQVSILKFLSCNLSMFTEEDSTTIDIEHKRIKKKYKNCLNFVTFKKL